MALGGILIEAGIGPLADSGLNKAFGFAVGAWSVDAGANMFKLEFAASGGEVMSIEARPVIGHDTAHRDAQAGEVSDGLMQEKSPTEEAAFSSGNMAVKAMRE